MKRKPRLDFTTLAGLPLGIAFVALGQFLEGGSPRSLLHLTAGLIVFGGLSAAILVSFTASDVKAAIRALRSVVFVVR